MLMARKGPSIIAAELNASNDLPDPFNHVNIINFRDSLPAETLRAIELVDKERAMEFYLKPVEEAREQIQAFQDLVMPKLITALKQADLKAIRVYHKAFTDLFDRLAKIEGIVEPRQEIKAKYVQVNQQFNFVLNRLFRALRGPKMCDSCRDHILAEMEGVVEEAQKVVTIDFPILEEA